MNNIFQQSYFFRLNLFSDFTRFLFSITRTIYSLFLCIEQFKFPLILNNETYAAALNAMLKAAHTYLEYGLGHVSYWKNIALAFL